MNTNPSTTEQPETTLHSSLCTLHSKRRRNGKVASLPKPHRDLVNRMLEDGVAYKEIVAALAQLGHSVSARNISNWYQGGYQDWLLHQERLAANRIREEAVLDILTNNHDVDLPAAGLQVAATHLCQLLLAAHPETADPDSGLDNYIRVANSLCRISHQLMKVQEFRDQYPDDPNIEDPSSFPFEVQGSEFEVQGSSASSPSPILDPPSSPLSQPTNPSPLSPVELEVQDSASNAQSPSPSAFEVQSSEFKVPR